VGAVSVRIYVTPRSTGQAYKFGTRSAMCGYSRMSRAEFLSNEAEPHPYPTSLYRAYRKGFAYGREIRARGLEAEPDIRGDDPDRRDDRGSDA
jgi:hypothetical protein